MAGIIKRQETWHLRMRVPTRYRLIEQRREIHLSLKTGDRDEAAALAHLRRKDILQDLDARLAGREPGSPSHYEALARIATSRGYGYVPARDLAQDISEILRRTDELISRGDSPASAAAAALLGIAERPRMSVLEVAEKMPEWYPQELKGKAPKPQKVWRARWVRPAKKLVDRLGHDPDFENVARSDVLVLRDSLRDLVIDEELKPASAAKEFQNLDLLWKRYWVHFGLTSSDIPASPYRDLAADFSKMEGEDGRKAEVPHEVLRRLVVLGGTKPLNEEASDLVILLAHTGARQSEIIDIEPSAIILDAPIPHLDIRKQTGEFARELKNASSARKIPLIGQSLSIMERRREGFPRYRGKGTFSAAANKSLHSSGVLPDGITIGGTRHSFEGRLRRAGIRDDDIGQMMGHSVKSIRGRPVYGDALTLTERAALMSMSQIE